jgi:isocitrate dehydrogenase
MTKDLALLIHKENMTSDNYLNTQAFLNAIKENLEKALA